MMHPDTAAAAALLCGAAGLLVPGLVARLPEPPATEPPATEPPAAGPPSAEPPKPLYADLARARGLGPSAAAVSALAGGLAGLVLGWDWSLALVLVLVPVGVALAVVDLRTRLLPKVVVLPLTAVVVVLAAVVALLDRDPDPLVRAALGLVAARSFYWLLWRVRSAGLGFGDVRLAAPLGAALGHLGWSQLVVGIYAGFLLFGVPGLVLAVVRRDRAMLRTAYPFGPAMLAGALVGVLAGEPLLAGLGAG